MDYEYEKCNDEEARKEKDWCGPSHIKFLSRIIPELFPCACKKHDLSYHNLTLREAIKVNDYFLLNMLHTVGRRKRNIFYKLWLYFMAFVYYFAVMFALPYYLYLWRKKK